jgi:hypothetical protein
VDHMTAIRRMNADLAYSQYMEAYRNARKLVSSEARLLRMTYGTRHHKDQLARVDAAKLKAERYLANAIGIASVDGVRYGERA